MITKNEILTTIAKERRVERLVACIAKGCKSQDDLSQMVYLALCEKSEEGLQKAWYEGWINYKIVAIITRQYYSRTSTFWRQIGRYITKEEEDIRPDGIYDEQWWEEPGRLGSC